MLFPPLESLEVGSVTMTTESNTYMCA